MFTEVSFFMLWKAVFYLSVPHNTIVPSYAKFDSFVQTDSINSIDIGGYTCHRKFNLSLDFLKQTKESEKAERSSRKSS